MPVMEISVVPLGTKNASVSKHVAGCLNVLRTEKHIEYELTAMGTIIQADSLKKLLQIAEKMHSSVFNQEVKRVVTTIKIDERSDKKLTINGKKYSVNKQIKNQ